MWHHRSGSTVVQVMACCLTAPNHQLFQCWLLISKASGVNSSPPGQNGRHFADDLFRCIFVNEKFFILIKISLKFVSKHLTDNNSAFGLDTGLVPNRQQAIIWSNVDPIHSIYTALGGDELIPLKAVPQEMIQISVTEICSKTIEDITATFPRGIWVNYSCTSNRLFHIN